MKNLVLYLFAGARSGKTRAIIVKSLKNRPMNLNQPAKNLKLNYKTIQHQIKIASENNILTAIKKDQFIAEIAKV